MAERVKACIICHGPEDKEGRDAYYPRIAGKPEGYLFNQLRNFRDGRRHYRPMALLLEGLPDQYLREMAAYFASLKQAFPPPEPMTSSPAEVELARRLITQGDPARKIPACIECHGKDLMGTAPFIPGLLGLPRVYIIAQFGNWQNGGADAGADARLHVGNCKTAHYRRGKRHCQVAGGATGFRGAFKAGTQSGGSSPG